MRLIAKITLSLSLILATTAWADSFVVQAIQVEGLDGISRDTVLAYLPVKIGQRFNTDNSSSVIHSLYDTGFFKDISLSRQGNTLVVRALERPVISSIDVSGNKDIDKDQFNSVLKNLGLVEGQVFSQAVLDKVVVGLQSEYYNRGRYNAQINTTVTPQARNRVAVKIDISEGLIAKVEGVNIIGNKAFSTKTLLDELPLATTGLFSFVSHDNQYSREKLGNAAEALANYYMDRGYIRFKIESTQASLTPDRKGVYVTFKINEGQVYHVSGVKLVGRLILPEAKLRSLVTIKPGDVFSKEVTKNSTKAISYLLGEQGYTFADVNPVPDIDDANHTVFLTIHVEPNRRVYVRQIKFTGNTQTADEVLRREMRQYESSLANIANIDESTRRLRLLPYIQDAKVDTLPVPGSTDQVDLDYTVTETPPATAMASVSYGTDGLGFSASVNNNNFLGTGKTMGIGFNTDTYVRTYSINYSDPYFTKDGVQRSFSIYSQRYTPGDVNITNYTYDTYGGSMTYSVPVSSKGDMIQYGSGFQHTNLHIGSDPSTEISDFVDQYGTQFNQVLLNGGWSRNGFDRSIFPTRGLNQSAGVQISMPANSSTAVQYFKVNYTARWLQPIWGQFILNSMANVGYGGGYGGTANIPFFQNYYAGGIGYTGSVRGYEANSLGPKDSLNNPLGGNLQTTGTVGLIFPNGISPDKLRTTLFMDAGNVYNTKIGSLPMSEQATAHAGPLRYSAGVAVEWRVPILGVLNFSVAKALNSQPGDQTEIFQFTFGTSF